MADKNTTPQHVIDTLYTIAQQLRLREPGVSNDIMAFINGGTTPVTPKAQALIAQTLRGSQWEGNLPGFYAAKQAAAQSPREDRTGMSQVDPTATGAQAGPPEPGIGTGMAVGGAAVGNTLAERIAEAARNGAAGATSGIGGSGAGATGYQERGPGYGPGPSGFTQQRGPGGANTLGTAFMREAGGNTPPGAGNPGGGFSAGQDEDVSASDNRLFRLAMEAAGLNPDRLTSFSKNAGRALMPLLQARRAAYGIAGDSAGGLAQDIADFAKGFTSGNGQNFYQGARDYATGVMGSDNFKNAIGGLSDQDSVAQMYQALMPLQYAGSNGLIQQAANDTFERTFAKYGDQDFNSNGQVGVFNDWLAKQQADPIMRRIFGLR